MTEQNSAPLLENEHVQALLAIMEANNAPNRKDLLAVLNQIGAMEKQLNAAVTELAAMRRELNQAREQAHPVKVALQSTVNTMEKNAAVLRERLHQAKPNLIEGCKNAVAAFKEKGMAALDNIARFFKIRPVLEAMRDDLGQSIRFNEATISNIELVSTEYHEAGRHIKNMVRAMAGKEAIQDATSVGKLAKALQAPFHAHLVCLSAMKNSVETALSRLAVLEKSAERKPSIQKTMQTFNEQITQGQKSAPATERPRPVAHDGR